MISVSEELKSFTESVDFMIMSYGVGLQKGISVFGANYSAVDKCAFCKMKITYSRYKTEVYYFCDIYGAIKEHGAKRDKT